MESANRSFKWEKKCGERVRRSPYLSSSSTSTSNDDLKNSNNYHFKKSNGRSGINDYNTSSRNARTTPIFKPKSEDSVTKIKRTSFEEIQRTADLDHAAASDYEFRGRINLNNDVSQIVSDYSENSDVDAENELTNGSLVYDYYHGLSDDCMNPVQLPDYSENFDIDAGIDSTNGFVVVDYSHGFSNDCMNPVQLPPPLPPLPPPRPATPPPPPPPPYSPPPKKEITTNEEYQLRLRRIDFSWEATSACSGSGSQFTGSNIGTASVLQIGRERQNLQSQSQLETFKGDIGSSSTETTCTEFLDYSSRPSLLPSVRPATAKPPKGPSICSYFSEKKKNHDDVIWIPTSVPKGTTNNYDPRIPARKAEMMCLEKIQEKAKLHFSNKKHIKLMCPIIPRRQQNVVGVNGNSNNANVKIARTREPLPSPPQPKSYDIANANLSATSSSSTPTTPQSQIVSRIWKPNPFHPLLPKTERTMNAFGGTKNQI